MYIKYRRARIKIETKKPDKCECCGKKAKKLDYHHWKYAYTTDEVIRNPLLVLDNTSVLCFPCHKRGDALRICWEEPLVTEKLNIIRKRDMK